GFDSIVYLGHTISANGIKPNPSSIMAVTNFPPPSDVPQLRRFLGLASYLRRFIPNFSKLALPLTTLLRKNTQWEWSTPQHESFSNIKASLAAAPLLATYDPSLPVEIYTDASRIGLGAWAAQGTNVLAYGSCSLHAAECNYSPIELELSAMVEAICK